jgi:shikimate kinase
VLRNIFLVGMPSSGKTSLGNALASHLHYRFIDLDEVIVETERISIAEIFKQKGEAHFRQLESAALKAIPPDSGLLIATGGGTPCFFDNMAFIKSCGLSIFLDVSPRELFRRVKGSKKNERPLLNPQDDATLLAALETKYRERLPFYCQADICIQDDRIDLGRILRQL